MDELVFELDPEGMGNIPGEVLDKLTEQKGQTVGSLAPAIIKDYVDGLQSILNWAAGGNPDGRDFIKEMDNDPTFFKSYGDFNTRFKREQLARRNKGLSEIDIMQAQIVAMMLGQNPYYTEVGQHTIFNDEARLGARLLRRTGRTEAPRLIKNLRRFQLINFAGVAKGDLPGIRLRHADPEKRLTKEEREEFRSWEMILAEKFFFRTGHAEANLSDVLGCAYEDWFDLDKVAFYIRRSRSGRPLGMVLMDAALIKPIVPRVGGTQMDRWDRKELEELGERLGKTKAKVFLDDYRYMMLDPAGSRRIKFKESSLVMRSFFTTTDTHNVYKGTGFIEQAVRVITSIINTITFNASRLTNQRVPMGMVALEGGANVNQIQVDLFKKMLWAYTMGAENRWRVPIIALPERNTIKWVPFHRSSQEMQLFDWLSLLITILCQLSGTDPEEISIASNRAAMTKKQAFVEESSERLVKRSQDKGLKTFLHFFSSIFNDTDLLAQLTGKDYLRLDFAGMETVDQKKRRDLQKLELQTHKSINDIRGEQDMPPAEFKIAGMNLYDVAALDDPTVSAVLQQKAQAEMMMAGQPGMPGGEEGESEYSQTDQNLIDLFGPPEEGGKVGEQTHSQAKGSTTEKETEKIEKSEQHTVKEAEEIVVTLED